MSETSYSCVWEREDTFFFASLVLFPRRWSDLSKVRGGLWQSRAWCVVLASSEQCERCPSGFASPGRAGSVSLALAPQMLLLDLQHQCRVGLLHFTLGGQLCTCSSVCCVPGSGTGGVEEDGALSRLAGLGKVLLQNQHKQLPWLVEGCFPICRSPLT